MNVDEQEIAKFEAMASRWWDLEGEFKPLHRLNPTRLAYINRGCGGLFGKTVLDVGCGGGILSESMAHKGAFVTGLDMGTEPLEVARLHALETGAELNYIQMPVEQHAAEQPAHYDVITCMEMLEHVPDPASVIQACAALLKPDGMIFFSTINRTLKSYLTMIVGAEYVLRWVPKGTHEHDKFIRPSELLNFTDRANLKCEDLTGVLYQPLSQRFYLDQNVDTNYMLMCRPR
ncbi:bifunctional 2-polyprenyl-6-hydroxyphenol methylase/3-demethylubiquinol 3-O-methyltransferase UbiG [Motilimonas pumila]|uniref:Ubiquinone biosynthesis O-methyltransferase n=1 Tax=Motilimonas pumila TaxID=2303987 RepID=A0A418YG72_9GAMM|nr:bifunctional 2-polyprenyl-6-hydroxyphenol methylase/3-demethylubiquinol 3-O-methyltransferase UbiG [Motilimonas pumila]RJG48644.1 bifunctional 2-polyprenyl-6-hydroxyphenol methylase/3-demethylubiquinol 3-O-methyltransferase UbiG [Motilimonas pumila]